MRTVTRIINQIIKVEGGYVDDPDDSGGETNFGITLAQARAYGYEGDMIDLPRETAFEIYLGRYWHLVKGDDMHALSPRVAIEIVDTGVNMGQAVAVAFLQRSLNVLNRRGELYPDMKVDGLMGPMTLYALRSYLDVRGESALLKALNCLQGAAYVELAERREKDESFVYGWLQHRVEI